ncbi:hypothetical protein EDD36DRAFT_455282 [Exophiala viscosa]|uniref:Uncharacterized protein n=1 Tax=Exophiala viscosa TaxID=2486360 RepID=A0AAN6E275_9EURO|nr:hypothetical protein EDD36DRAFT_455282 [Exophiala viscosa]
MAVLLQGSLLITGAVSGIGRATALCMVRHGVTKLALGDIKSTQLPETKDKLLSKGSDLEVLVLELDVRSDASTEKAFAEAVAAFGRIDYLINNAGVPGSFTPTDQLSYSDWQRPFDVNLHAAIQQMLKQDMRETSLSRGSIVNVASILGLTGSSNPASGYSASKHAVIGLTRTDARHCAKQGIRINAVCPGYIDTPIVLNLDETVRKNLISQIPAGRPGKPEEVGNAIVFLASDLSSFMYGKGLVVDGGQICH